MQYIFGVNPILIYVALVLFGIVIGMVVYKNRNRIDVVSSGLEQNIRDSITYKDLFTASICNTIAVLICLYVSMPLAVIGASQIALVEPKMHYLLVVGLNFITLVFVFAIFVLMGLMLISLFVGRRNECNGHVKRNKGDTL